MGIGITHLLKTNEKLDMHMKQFLLDIVQQIIKGKDPGDGINNEVMLIIALAYGLKVVSRLCLRDIQHPAWKSTWKEEMELEI